MSKRQSVVDVFHAVKTLRNSKPSMVDTPVSVLRGKEDRAWSWIYWKIEILFRLNAEDLTGSESKPKRNNKSMASQVRMQLIGLLTKPVVCLPTGAVSLLLRSGVGVHRVLLNQEKRSWRGRGGRASFLFLYIWPLVVVWCHRRRLLCLVASVSLPVKFDLRTVFMSKKKKKKDYTWEKQWGRREREEHNCLIITV